MYVTLDCVIDFYLIFTYNMVLVNTGLLSLPSECWGYCFLWRVVSVHNFSKTVKAMDFKIDTQNWHACS